MSTNDKDKVRNCLVFNTELVNVESKRKDVRLSSIGLHEYEEDLSENSSQLTVWNAMITECNCNFQDDDDVTESTIDDDDSTVSAYEFDNCESSCSLSQSYFENGDQFEVHPTSSTCKHVQFSTVTVHEYDNDTKFLQTNSTECYLLNTKNKEHCYDVNDFELWHKVSTSISLPADAILQSSSSITNHKKYDKAPMIPKRYR